MQYHLKTIVFTNQRNTIEKLGDKLWDAICDNVSAPMFTMRDCVDAVRKEFGYSHTTAENYARAVILNVRAESGDEVVQRTGNMYRWA